MEADDSTARRLTTAPEMGRRKSVAVAAIVALVYLAGVTNRWVPTPDSATYLGLGRSLAEGRGYVFNGQVNTRFAPGLPFILAGLMRVFADGLWAPNLFVALCGLAMLLVSYLSLRRLASEAWMPLAVTLSTAFSYPVFVSAHRILTDMPFALFFWIVVYAALRHMQAKGPWLVVAGLASAAGVIIRAPGIVLLAPLALCICLDRRAAAGRRLAAAAVILCCSLATGVLLYVVGRRAGEAPPGYETLVVTSVSYGMGHVLGRIAGVAATLPQTAGELIAGQSALWPLGLATVGIAAVGVVSLWRRGDRITSVAVAYTIILAAALGSFGLNPRYLFVVMPFGMYAVCAGLSGLRFSGRAIAIAAGIVVALNAPKVARDAFYYSALSRSADYADYYERIHGRWHAELAGAAQAVRQACPEDAMVATAPEAAPIIHYLSGRRTIPLPFSERRRLRDTGDFSKAVGRCSNASFILIDSRLGDPRFVAAARTHLDAETAWRLVRGDGWALYERVK